MQSILNGVLYEEDFPLLEIDFEMVFDFRTDSFVGTEVSKYLDAILRQVRENRSGVYQGIIRFVIYPCNEQIDLGIFGLLCLIKSRDKSIRVVFDLRKLGEKSSHPIAFKIRQYSASSFIFFENVLFEVENPSGCYDITQVVHKDTWLTISNKFIPVFKIEESFYTHAFLKNTDERAIDYIFDEILAIGTLGKNRTSQFLFKKGLDVSFEEYSILCFFSALCDLRLVDHFMTEYSNRKHTRPISKKPWSKIPGNPHTEYYKPITKLLKNVLHQPLFFVLLFSKLTSNIIGKYTIRPTERGITYSELAKKIEEIYSVSYVIFSGLREIAANIAEHTSEKSGALVARIFDLQELVEFKKINFPYFKEYAGQLSCDRLDEQFLLDISIFDLSNIGIVECFLSKTVPDQHRMLNGLNVAHDDNFPEWRPKKRSLVDFFNYPSFGIGHEVFRIIANIGLIVFKKNIDILNGFFFVSSPSSKEASGIDRFTNVKNTDLHENGYYTNGTHYTIVFPLLHKSAPEKELIQIYPHVQWNNFTEKTNILEYGFINQGETPPKVGFMEIEINESLTGSTSKYKQENDIVDYIREKTDGATPEYLIPIINIKSEKIKNEGPGTIIRLLAGLKFKTSFRDVVVLGCSKEIILSVIDILNSKEGIFWGENYCVIFYTAYQDYFIPIILFGNQYQHFVNLNYFSNDILIGKDKPSDAFPDVSGSNLFDFISDSTCRMIEVDTIVEVEGLTIFEHYAKACLMKELNPHHD